MDPSKPFSMAVLCIVAVLVAAARSEGESPPDSEMKPHFLYMKRLREHLSDHDLVIPDSSDRSGSVEGKLVATSLETQNSTGRAYSERGFILDGRTDVTTLEFTIHRESARGPGYPDVELWLFADKTHIPANRIMELRFLVKAYVPPATNPRSTQPIFLWNTNEDCVYLNLTKLSKRILRIINDRNLNESKVRLEVEVVYVADSRDRIENNPINMARQDLCASLSQRTSNKSFLIIKNYDESSAPFTPQSQRSNTLSKRNVLGVADPEVADSAPAVPNIFLNPCGVVPLMANLVEMYGDFIKAPIMTDVKDCSGRCTLLYDRSLFTKHGEIKQRLKLLPGGEVLSNSQSYCMPTRFKPLNVLIRLEGETSEVIVQMPDLVVDKCACQ